MECPSCHKEITADAFFCTWCSKFLPSPEIGEKANFFVRWVALVLDPLIAVVLYLMAIATVGVISPDLGMAVAVLLPIAYFVWFLSLLRTGRTPGKLFMGLQVVHHQTGELPGFGKMFLREIIGRFISGLFFGLGYWWALFDKNGQAWHDKLAGTVVLRVSPATAAEPKVDRDSSVPVRPNAPDKGPESQKGTPARRGHIPLLVGSGAALSVAAVAGFLLFRPGTLQVTAQAEAVPRLDGKGGVNATWKQLANTPAGVVTEAKVRAGTYHLRVGGPQMASWDSTIAIHGGQTTRIVIPNLTSLGTWSITSNVPALVNVDGVDRGKTPIEIGGLSVGMHALRLSAPGYVERGFPPLPVFPNRHSPMHFRLDRDANAVARTAEDPGAARSPVPSAAVSNPVRTATETSAPAEASDEAPVDQSSPPASETGSEWTSQHLVVSARNPAGATTRPLADGVEYILEVSGTYDAWGHTPNAVDAVACFADPQCTAVRRRKLAQGLKINGQGLIDLSGGTLAYSPNHAYSVMVTGQGRPLVMYIHDARGSGGDNVGGLAVRISRKP
jgi:uncharacterized RDD family membrane protein YckC